MKHVWLVEQKAKLRVWSDATEKWLPVDSWQELNEYTFLGSTKSNNQDICLYFPTQSALQIENELSNAQIKQLGESGQQYLFEELSLTPVEELQVRHVKDETSSDLIHIFYGLSQSQIEQWQQSAQLAGFKIVGLLPDFLLLPPPLLAQHQLKPQTSNLQHPSDSVIDSVKKSVSLYFDKIANSYLIRFSIGKGMAVSHTLLLKRALKDVQEISFQSSDSVLDKSNLLIDQSDEHDISNVDQNLIPQEILQLSEDDDPDIKVIKAIQSTITPVKNPTRHPLNFTFAKRTNRASPYLTLAASLLLLAGVLQIAVDAFQWYQYDKALLTTRKATEAQFKEWLPEKKFRPTGDIAIQVQPYLARSQDNKQQQLTILDRVSPLIKQSNLTAQSIYWDETNIVIVLNGQRREEVDKLQQTLNEQGINANLGSVNPTSNGGVVSELNIAVNNKDAVATDS